MYGDLLLYGGLFLNAFVAATLLPAFSEASFAALLASNSGVPVLLFISVTTGNILGACVNYWLGTKLLVYQRKRWFPFTPEQIEGASTRFRQYGLWSLLFAWLPIVGDPLTLVAGLLRVRLGIFLLLMSLGKAARYGVIWMGIAAL